MATDAQLKEYFGALCASATTRRSGIVMAIEDGATSTDEFDQVNQVTQVLWKAASDSSESAWTSKELARLVPLDEPDSDGFPQVPTVNQVQPCEPGEKMEPWCWALRVGYARDRVIGYARVKQAMFDVLNLTSSPETQTAMFDIWARVNATLRTHERGLSQVRSAERTAPEVDLRSQRAVWTKASKEIANAQRQQPTMLHTPLVTGLTAREIGAMAADPGLLQAETHAVGRATPALMEARDALMGTETFVSFVFPAAAHVEMHAVGATDQGVHIGNETFKCPAMVTLHNATGAIEPLCKVVGAPCASNVYVTNDAAALLVELHSLIMTARKSPWMASDTRSPLPVEQQRNYLLLQHGLF